MSSPSLQPAEILGVILAGGRSRRMGGGDKALLELCGRPLIVHVVERVRSQVGALVINANGDPSRFAAVGLPVIADTVPGFAGPLAGILAGMRHGAKAGFPAIATFPADTPFPAPDQVERLAGGLGRRTGIAIARSGGRLHPLACLASVALARDLEAFIAGGASLKVTDWVRRLQPTIVEFEGAETPVADPFFNINTPEDLEEAAASIALQRLPKR